MIILYELQCRKMNANRPCIYDFVRFYFANVPLRVRSDFTLFDIYSDINENLPFRSLFEVLRFCHDLCDDGSCFPPVHSSPVPFTDTYII